MGGIEYHITTDLAIMIVSLMSLYMWYTKEHSLWMKTRHGCILWRCRVWHSRNIEWKQDIEELAQFCMQWLEQVIVFLISYDWEGIFCYIKNIIKYVFAHNLPQPPTPSTSYTPVTTHTPPTTQTPQPPIAIHTHQPHTSLQPHTTQSHTHSTATHTPKPPTPIQLPTHINHTYPPTTHTWCQSILYKWIHWNKMTQLHEKH